MLEFKDYIRVKRAFLSGPSGPRASGKTFRRLLEAAHTVSEGRHVTLWFRSTSASQFGLHSFLDMVGRWNFRKLTTDAVKQVDSGGLVLFKGFPHEYSQYQRVMIGRDAEEIFDI